MAGKYSKYVKIKKKKQKKKNKYSTWGKQFRSYAKKKK